MEIKHTICTMKIFVLTLCEPFCSHPPLAPYSPHLLPPPGKKDESPEPGHLLEGVGGREEGGGGEGEGLSMPVLVEQQLQSQKLNLLSEKNLTEALTQFVDKEDTDAISE